MNTLETLLLIVGIIIIVISFIVISHEEKKRKEKHDNDRTIKEKNDEEIAKRILESKKELEEYLIEISDIYIESGRKELNQRTNEKIISIQEFADQIISDMKNNRDEVLFLYQILNEKENTLKKSDISLTTNVRKQKTGHSQERSQNTDNASNNLPDISNISQNSNKTEDIPESEFESEDKKEKYKKIIGLYNQGNSVAEISQALGLGQGEVKLYIDINKKLVRRG